MYSPAASRLIRLQALLLSHDHADACFGLDDLRYLRPQVKSNVFSSLTLRGTFAPAQDHISIYTSPETYASISTMFPYMVDAKRATGGGDIPSFQWHPFDTTAPFDIPSCGNLEVVPLPVEHGMYFSDGQGRPYMCMGFRIGPLAYVSDANRICDETKAKIEGCRVLILDALRETPHASHFSFQEVSHGCRCRADF
jgi:phosphoribosyl 1,2-cyclic phosphodiesterase